MNPQININNIKFEYDPNQFIYTDILFNPEIPSQYELKNSKKYENKITNYQIYKDINGGIFKDNPDFQNFKNTTPFGDENGFVSDKLNSAGSEQRLSQLEDY